VDSGTKSFNYIINATHTALDSCQKNLINLDLKMKNGGDIPHFLYLHRTVSALKVADPTFADVGTYFA